MRKTSDLTRFEKRVIAVMVAAQLGTVCVLASCTPAAKSAEAEASYTADLLACVDKATTLEQSKECRKGVDAKWGVHQDGGVE